MDSICGLNSLLIDLFPDLLLFCEKSGPFPGRQRKDPQIFDYSDVPLLRRSSKRFHHAVRLRQSTEEPVFDVAIISLPHHLFYRARLHKPTYQYRVHFFGHKDQQVDKRA